MSQRPSGCLNAPQDVSGLCNAPRDFVALLRMPLRMSSVVCVAQAQPRRVLRVRRGAEAASGVAAQGGRRPSARPWADGARAQPAHSRAETHPQRGLLTVRKIRMFFFNLFSILFHFFQFSFKLKKFNFCLLRQKTMHACSVLRALRILLWITKFGSTVPLDNTQNYKACIGF